MPRRLPTKITWDFNDGDIVTFVELADGAAGGGWGISRVEVTSSTPVRPDFLQLFLEATAQMVLTSVADELIAAHDAEDQT